MMQEFRCKQCGKLLAKIEGRAEIKCPRCKTVKIKTEVMQVAFESTMEKLAADALSNGFRTT